jgi:hypothetical protein
MNHLTLTQFYDYLDKVLDKQLHDEMQSHLDSCNQCSARLKELKKVEVSLRMLPVEQTSSGFTPQVMKQIRVEEPSIAWQFLKNLAPFVALVLVVGIVYAVLSFTDSFQNSEAQSSVTSTQSLLKDIMSRLASGMRELNTVMGKLFPFSYDQNGYGLTLFLLLFFGAVALIDKYFLAPMMRRKFR